MSINTYYMVTLGCAKNTVDSESMAILINQAGYIPVDKPHQAKFLIVNTCGFIETARKESMGIMHELARKKYEGQFLIAAGCLTQRYPKLVSKNIQGIDGILGTRQWMDITKLIHELESVSHPSPINYVSDKQQIKHDEKGVLRAAIQGSSAYLKIADGCRRSCAYCAIPLIKGTAVSRPLETIIKDARVLQNMGIQELILISQDTTDYGHDFGLEDGLLQLLKRLIIEVQDIPWIRILYTYPGYITDRLVEIMAKEPQILRYLDIPLQHAHPAILRRMRRPSNIDQIFSTLEKLRTAMPDLALRSTFIVGYPGETEIEFQTLLNFIAEIKFDHIGAFTFSFEKGTSSEPLGDPIPPEIKQERKERLMLLQKKISLNRNQLLLGKTLQVLIEGSNDGISIGRSHRDAPEIDGLVLIEGEAPVGKIVSVQIIEAFTHDLVGNII